MPALATRRVLAFRDDRGVGMMDSMMGGSGENDQEHKGMMIDMPGMAGMHMSFSHRIVRPSA
jgi:hypothetical protein